MKKCDEILELFSLYIDNELDDEAAKLVKEHVELCSSCKDELLQLQQVVKMCNEVEEVELPEGFNEVLHQKLELEHKKMEADKKITIMRSRILKTISSVAAIFIVIFAARGLMNIGMQNKVSTMFSKVSENSSMSIDNGSEAALSTQTADMTIAYDDAIKNENGDEAFVAKSDATNSEGKGEVGANPNEAVVAKDKSDNNEDLIIKFTESVQTEDTYLMARVPAGGAIKNIITLTAKAENIESEKLKIKELADKFGTKIEVSESNFFDKDTEIHSFGGDISKSAASYEDSYSMDKASYDKFIKEIENKYRGRYTVSKGEDQLAERLKEINNRLKELEKNNSINTDEYKNLTYDKEDIMKQLDNLKLNNNIRVDIKIYGN